MFRNHTTAAGQTIVSSGSGTYSYIRNAYRAQQSGEDELPTGAVPRMIPSLVVKIASFLLYHFGGLFQLLGIAGITYGIKDVARREAVSSRWWDWSAIVAGLVAALVTFGLFVAQRPGPAPPLKGAINSIYAFSGVSFAVVFYSTALERFGWLQRPDNLASIDQRVRGKYYRDGDQR